MFTVQLSRIPIVKTQLLNNWRLPLFYFSFCFIVYLIFLGISIKVLLLLVFYMRYGFQDDEAVVNKINMATFGLFWHRGFPSKHY